MENGRFYKDLELLIYDIFGRAVPITIIQQVPAKAGIRDGGRNWQIDVSALPQGIYLVVLREDAKIAGSAKFVISR